LALYRAKATVVYPTILSLWYVAEALGVKLQHFFARIKSSVFSSIFVFPTCAPVESARVYPDRPYPNADLKCLTLAEWSVHHRSKQQSSLRERVMVWGEL
jgi:hypothetical protein